MVYHRLVTQVDAVLVVSAIAETAGYPFGLLDSIQVYAQDGRDRVRPWRVLVLRA